VILVILFYVKTQGFNFYFVILYNIIIVINCNIIFLCLIKDAIEN